MSDSVRPHGLQPTRLLRPWDSPGKNTGVGCHFLLQNTLERINSRIPEAEEWISEPEDQIVAITSEEKNKVKRMKRTEDSFRDLWDQSPTFEL